MTGKGMPAFKTKLLCPADPGKDEAWAFLLLPKAVSDELPRRGRTSVNGTINGHPFLATLDPDGQLGHWLKVSKALQSAAATSVGDVVEIQISPADPEPEPVLPGDLLEALASSPAPGLDPLDRIGKAGQDTGAPGPECMRHAGLGQEARLLL
jgi:hypothetical protein